MEGIDALIKTVKRDYLDGETLQAALETLLVVFMFDDHPVSVHSIKVLILVCVSTEYAAKVTGYVHQGFPVKQGVLRLGY